MRNGRGNIMMFGLLSVLFAAFLAACGGGGGKTNGNVGAVGIVSGHVTSQSAVAAQVAKFGVLAKLAKQNVKASAKPSTSLALATGTVPVPGAVCTVEGTDLSGTTDTNGLFTINNVTQGSHILICKKSAVDGNTYAFLNIIDVSASQTTDIGTVEITQTAKIQGKATLSGLSDYAGIKVYIPGTSMQATTDSSGAYLLTNVPAGTHKLRFEYSGYKPVTLDSFVVTAGQTAATPDINLNTSTGASGNITINNGSPNSASRNVPVSITASADTTLMQISEDSTFVGATWQPVVAATTYTFTSDGQKRLYIKLSDANGLESAPVGSQIIIDTTSPTGSIVINNGAAAVKSPNVTLTLSMTDAMTSVSQMMISNNADFSDGAWETFTATKAWSLTSGDGSKTVYAKFMDLVGNETQVLTASIVLDTSEPITPSISIQEGIVTGSTAVHLNLSASGATAMKISEDPNFTGVAPKPYAISTVFTLSPSNGTKTIYVIFLDDAGNVTSPVSATIALDTIDASVSNPTDASATLNASFLNTSGSSVSVHFEYGTTTDYGTATTAQVYSSSLVSVSANLTNLNGGTTYHYRAVVVYNGSTVQAGMDRSFTTLVTPTTLLSGANNIVAMTLADGSLYWIDSGGLKTMSIAGGQVTTIAASVTSGLWLQVSGTNAYWTDYSTSYGITVSSNIKTIPLAGGSVSTLVTTPIYDIKGMKVDASSVYWMDSYSPSVFGGDVSLKGSGGLRKIPLGGGEITTLASTTNGSSLTLGGSYVYWTDGSGLHKVDKNGGTITVLDSMFLSGFLTVDSTSIYVSSGVIYKMPLQGGTSAMLSANYVGPRPEAQIIISADGSSLYLLQAYLSGSLGDYQIGKVASTGGNLTNIASGTDGALFLPVCIVSDSANIYWATQTGIKKISK